MLLFAAGRVGATDRLNLDAAGIAVDHRGRIAVDPVTLQTSVPHIYAAGDVIGFPSLASTSMEQGRVAACHALGMEPLAPPEFFPYGIYSVPEISTTGLTEEEVRQKGIPYEVGVARFRETSRGHIMGLDSGMMKMIFSTKTRDRADPYRPGRAQPERHDRLLHPEHVQLSDAGRGLQDRRAGCMEQDDGAVAQKRHGHMDSWPDVTRGMPRS
jgi:hypothetical protein